MGAPHFGVMVSKIVDDMGSKQATDQVHYKSQTLDKYPIRVRIRVRVKVRVRVQLMMEQPHKFRIIIN